MHRLFILVLLSLAGCVVAPAPGVYVEGRPSVYVEGVIWTWDPVVELWFFHDRGRRHYGRRGFEPRHGGHWHRGHRD